jgi:hypothetical protein
MSVQENPRNPVFLLASLAQIFQRRTHPPTPDQTNQLVIVLSIFLLFLYT